MTKKPNNKASFYKSTLIAHVRHYGAVSRTQLGQSTHIRMPVVTALIRELIENGVLVESGRSVAGRGRKQILLSLNGRHGFVVGIEFDLDHMLAVGVDVCGNVVAKQSMPMPALKTNTAIVKALIALTESMIRESGYERSALKGIGIADPGIVDSKAGVSLMCTLMPEWRNVPLRRLVESHFAVPVLLDENTRTKTLCEHRHGAGQGLQHLLLIDVGSGIGCGIIMDGQLYRGHTNMAGELGHVRVVENGPICNCGSSGCLETVASYPAIIRQVIKALQDGTQSMIAELAGHRLEAISMAHVFEAAGHGDKLALGLLDHAIQYLGYAIANAVNLFNPEAVLINAHQAAAEDLIVAPIQQIIDRHTIRLSGKSPEIRVAKIGEEAGAWGAAMLILDQLFASAAGAVGSAIINRRE
ncbi:MAG: ROK family protein [Verrucomicrobia bacterium]|nr:ROK family protein [Verrucomicrobiota bacterium]MBU1734558.1 ROK family protein [Verrucomicrobiota bacterium]MBU1856627.1 ROK family protein [Verrucomicrobiota bacterium]